MRKFLILALALVMVFSLTACKKDSDDTSDSTPTVTDPVDTEATDTNTTNPSDTDNTVEPEETDEPEDTDDTDNVGTTNLPDEDEDPDGTEFVSVNETVYVYGTSILNVRKEPSKDSEKVGEMKEGEQVTRIGYNDNWSKISYYGDICYASSDYLTTSAPLSFTDKTDKVYITAEGRLNLRKKPSANADIVAYLPYGTELSRTGIADKADADGITWSRVLYNGEVCYASSSYLAKEAPLSEFEVVYENVYVVSSKDGKIVESLNLRATPSLSGNIVYTIPAETQLLRVGIAKSADDEGIVWSKILYSDGTVCYASSSYLTTVAPDSIPDVDIPAGYVLYQNDDIAFAYPMEWEKTDGSIPIMLDLLTGNNITVAYDAKTDYSTLTRSVFVNEMQPILEATGLEISNASVKQKTHNGLNITIISYDAVTVNEQELVQTLIYVNTSSHTYNIVVTEATTVPGLVDNVYKSIVILK